MPLTHINIPIIRLEWKLGKAQKLRLAYEITVVNPSLLEFGVVPSVELGVYPRGRLLLLDSMRHSCRNRVRL